MSIIVGFILIIWYASHNEVEKWIIKVISFPIRKYWSMPLGKMQDNYGTLDRIFHLPLLFWIYLPSFILTGKTSQNFPQMNVHSGIGTSFSGAYSCPALYDIHQEIGGYYPMITLWGNNLACSPWVLIWINKKWSWEETLSSLFCLHRWPHQIHNDQ